MIRAQHRNPRDPIATQIAVGYSAGEIVLPPAAVHAGR